MTIRTVFDLFRPKPKVQSIGMKVYNIAKSRIGITEWAGSKHNPEILKMFADSGNSWVKDDETAWCAAFVASVLLEAGVEHTGKLNARSYMDWGVATSTPKPGDVVVFWRGSEDGWQGHVAFYHGKNEAGIWVIGGNQGNKVSLVPYSEARLLGYRTYA